MGDERLQLQLLGTFRASVAGVDVRDFRTDKARALLAYLAIERERPHLRTTLATLLWPDMPDEIALRNLRKTLHRLGEALRGPASPNNSPLLVSRHAVEINAASWDVDLWDFRDLVREASDHKHPELSRCPACLDRLSRAVDLYRGEMLAGITVREAEPFDEWLLVRREVMQHEVLQTLYELAAAHLERGDHAEAYQHAGRQVELDPGREEAHRQVIRALAQSGQRAEALAYIGRMRQVLLQTLGVEPDPVTEELVTWIETGEGETAPNRRPGAGARPASQLPVHLTPFVGREDELRRIAKYLHDGEVRAISIVGPGGMGKTRLAVRAAEQAVADLRPADGVVFVPLAEVETLPLAADAILTASGLEIDPATGLVDQLVAFLASREILVVLDNLEHLPDIAGLILQMLEAGPGVRILATSRVPLGLLGEQRLSLGGLAVPGDGDLAPVTPADGSVLHAGSVRLFVEAAQRAEPAFRLTSGNLEHVLAICRLVEGMPLALELAAAWVRVLECSAIEESIERSLDLLATDARNVPHRQRTIETVFRQSWEFLSAGERAVLSSLSVFRGPFDLSAAVTIAGATPVVLASFLDIGLLGRTRSGRYALHRLVRQFAAATTGLSNLDLDATRERHARHYLGLAARAEPSLYGRDPRSALEALQPDLSNLQEAWSWAARAGRTSQLLNALNSMVRFCDLSSNVEVAGMLIAAAMSVDGAGQTPQHVEDSERLLVRFQAWEARVAETRNRVDDGVALAESALARAERSNDVEGAAIAQAALGEILLRRREFVRAASLLHAAARHFAGTAPRHHARVLRLQGTVQWRAGNYSRAREFLKQARSMQESIGDLWETAHVAYTLGGIAFEKGEFSEAQVHADEALRDYEACGDRGHSAWLRGNLALIYQCLGQLDRALEYNGLHVTASRETGNRHALAIALGNRADILAEIGRLDNARQCLDESMSLEGTMGNGWDVARHRAALARLLDLQGEQDLARAHFEQALPVLRAGEARFYAVGPLLDASELALKGGRLEDAEALNQEAGALAERLALEPAIARSRDLDEQIARGRAVATAERHQRAADL